MDRAVIDWLIENDIFEAVMTATRGPDVEDRELKRWLTAPLRWAIGFYYGCTEPPRDETLEIVSAEDPISGLRKFKAQTIRLGHFLEHGWSAFRMLRKSGYELSRIPLWCYLAPDGVQEEFGNELRRRVFETMEPEDKSSYLGLLSGTGLVWGDVPFRRVDL
jgi:hypothetical protein